MDTKTSAQDKLTSATAILVYLSIIKLILLIIFAGNYGLFRDEYYYIACSKNLAWGFVDQQPLSSIILALSRFLFGDSIIGIRILSYIAGSLIVFVGGLLARELGGGKFAQTLTALMVMFCGVILGVSGYFSMNAFDILLSALLFYYLIRLVKTEDPQMWIYIGIVFGIGFQNKLSFLFLGFGLAVGLILTSHKKYLLKKELWLGAGIAFLLFLPNLIWQIVNGFPTFEFMHNAAMYKNQPMSILEFILNASLELNPGFVLYIIIALYFMFICQNGKIYKIIGWMFISIFLLFVFNNGKPYYMGVLYPVMLAAGAVGADFLIEKYLKNWVRIFLLVGIIPSAFIVTPFAIPVLDVEPFIEFTNLTGIKPGSGERSELGVLPQFFADRFGWEEMVQKVSEVYNQLSEEEKQKALILGQNYGEAGAVDYYGKKYGLPKAISNHNNYWLWGYPENYNGEILIVIGSTYEDNLEFFEEVELAASHRNKYCMPYENVDIFVCRKPKLPIAELWRRIKNFI